MPGTPQKQPDPDPEHQQPVTAARRELGCDPPAVTLVTRLAGEGCPSSTDTGFLTLP